MVSGPGMIDRRDAPRLRRWLHQRFGGIRRPYSVIRPVVPYPHDDRLRRFLGSRVLRAEVGATRSRLTIRMFGAAA